MKPTFAQKVARLTREVAALRKRLDRVIADENRRIAPEWGPKIIPHTAPPTACSKRLAENPDTRPPPRRVTLGARGCEGRKEDRKAPGLSAGSLGERVCGVQARGLATSRAN